MAQYGPFTLRSTEGNGERDHSGHEKSSYSFIDEICIDPIFFSPCTDSCKDLVSICLASRGRMIFHFRQESVGSFLFIAATNDVVGKLPEFAPSPNI
jgi:hypothetical protein